MGVNENVRLHALLTLLKRRKKRRRENSLYTGVNMMNKTSVLVVNIVWCSTSAAPQHSRTHKHTLAFVQVTQNPLPHVQTYNKTHTPLQSRTCTDKVNQTLRKMTSNTHTRCHTHTHTVVQSVEQACWVAVSTYSAAMATSSTAIDSTAKWVRVCECDNLVKITFKPNILHKNAALGFSASKKLFVLTQTLTIGLSAASNYYERKSKE